MAEALTSSSRSRRAGSLMRVAALSTCTAAVERIPVAWAGRVDGYAGNAGDLGPNLKGLNPGGSILGGGHLMAAEVEEVVDLAMGGEETLRLAG